MGYSPWGPKELDTTECMHMCVHAHTHAHTHTCASTHTCTHTHWFIRCLIPSSLMLKAYVSYVGCLSYDLSHLMGTKKSLTCSLSRFLSSCCSNGSDILSSSLHLPIETRSHRRVKLTKSELNKHGYELQVSLHD